MLVSWQARVAASVVGRPRHVASGHRVFASLSVDPDHKKDIDRIMELAKKSVESWDVQVTSFYSPAVISDARKVLERMADVECIEWGGFERAERQRLLLGREEVLYACEEEMKENAVAAVNVSGNFLFDKASHPDFLGSVLGTGIERSVIGDILVQGESGAHVLCSPSIVEHLESALVQVRSVPVRTEVIDVGTQLRVPEARVKEIHTVENSQRLDAVASAGFRMSRSKMADMIKAGDVRVNWKECKKPSVDVVQGDVISAKGYGRLEVSSISMSSKGASTSVHGHVVSMYAVRHCGMRRNVGWILNRNSTYFKFQYRDYRSVVVMASSGQDVKFERPKDCPACGQPIFRKSVFQKHVERCCPDSLEKGGLPSLEQDIEVWVEEAKVREAWLQEEALKIAFRQRNERGEPIRQGPDVIAQQIGGMTEERAEKLLKAAMKAIPLVAEKGPMDVLYEDDIMLGLNKPPFVITAPKHRFEGGSLVNRVLGNTGKMPYVVHRLDMNTSGVLLFAKNSETASLLHEQFRNKTPRKTYLALVLGTPEWDETTLDAPIGKNTIEKVARAVTDDGKPATTKFKVLCTSNKADFREYMPGLCIDEKLKGEFKRMSSCSLVQCEPLTGRTHQIRVHLAHLGYPIIGDDLYGITGPCINRHALHAAKLLLKYPTDTLKSFHLEAPLPDDFALAMEAMQLT